MRGFYQIELQKPCKVQIDNPDFNEDEDESDDNRAYIEIDGEPGMIVNIDETKKLEDLRTAVKNGGTYDVWFVIDKKIELDNDQTMWQLIGPKLRMVKAPSNLGA